MFPCTGNDTLVLLQSADAFESMRDHQLAMAEPEHEEEDTPGPSPRLWSSSSPHASFPYPSTPPIIEACWQHQDHAPDQLQPALPDGPCHCGLQYTNAYIRVNKACRILYPAPRCGCKRELFELQCPNQNPSCTVVYDGIDDGLFHFSNESCVSLWLLYQYADQFQNDGKTLSAFVHDQCEVYRQHRHTSLPFGDEAFCSVQHFRQVYQAWAIKVDRKFLFRCPVCGDQPPVLVGDATSESIQARYYCGQSITDAHADSIAQLRPHVRADRCMFRADADRKLLKGLASYVRGDNRTAFGHQKITADKLFVLDDNEEALMEAAMNQNMGSLVADVAHMCDRLAPSDRKVLGKMLGSLASDSPAISYSPLTVANAFEPLFASHAHGYPAEFLELLQNEAPLFLEFSAVLDRMHDVAVLGSTVMSKYIDFVKKLVERTLTCATGGPALSDYECEQRAPSSTSDSCLTSGVCVGVSQVHHRPKYSIDGDKDATECRHQFISGSHGSKRTGGIFTWFCRHGICYAFYIIPNAEGRNEAFSFLLKYFKVAPKVVVYDFACALQDYCLNRQPEHFRDTTFLVDRFHWFNHVSCARSYSLSSYLQYAYLNSQVAEQCNSALTRIKCSISQMKQVTFMSGVRFFLEMWNQRKNDSLQVIRQHASQL